MTDPYRLARIAFVAILVLSLATATALPAVAAADSTDGADLIVEQPDYVDSDVDERSDDGTPVYIVDGDAHHIHPQNFDSGDVTDYGVATGSGALSYNDALDRYEFDPEGDTGSFELYWSVENEFEVEDGNETVTETETVQYEAVIRVDGLTSPLVMDADEAAELRDDAREWNDWNATVTEVRESSILGHSIMGSPTSNAEVMQSMVNAYLTMRSPTHLLEGGFVAAVIIVATTLGGLAFFLAFKIPDLFALRKIFGEYFKMKSVKEAEGDVAERQEQADLETRLQAFANIDWQDIPSVTDHEAAEARKAIGETPLEGLLKFAWVFDDNTMKEDRVRVMGAAGYVAQVDGGGDTIESAQLVHRNDALDADETMDERDDLVPVTKPSETLLEAIPDDDPELNDFPLDTAEFDLDDLAEPPETLSIPQIVDQFEFSEHGFEDNERIGTFIREFVVMINNHPITDDDGAIDPARLELEKLLQFFQAADDRYQVPLAKWYKQHFARAVDEYDRDDELRTFLDKHRSRTDG